MRWANEDEEWVAKGKDLADVLWFMAADSDWLAGTLENVAAGEEVDIEVTVREGERLGRVAGWLKRMMYYSDVSTK